MNNKQEISESEAKPRILFISCFLLVTQRKAQVKATKSVKVSNYYTDNWRLLVSNLLLRTKVAPDDVPYRKSHACSRPGSH